MKTVYVDVPFSYPNPRYLIMIIHFRELCIRTYKDPTIIFSQDSTKERIVGINETENSLGNYLKNLTTDDNKKIIDQIEFSYSGIIIKKTIIPKWNTTGPVLVKSLKTFFKKNYDVDLEFPKEFQDWY